MIYSKTNSAIYFVAIFLIIFIGICNAATFIQPAAKHPDYPGKCFNTITKRPMLPDKLYRPKGICAAMTCEAETFNISIETCPSIEMPECEELPVNPIFRYPKCCPQYLCTDFHGHKSIVDVFTL